MLKMVVITVIKFWHDVVRFIRFITGMKCYAKSPESELL